MKFLKTFFILGLIVFASAFSGYLAGLKNGTRIGYNRAKADAQANPYMCGTGQYQLQRIRQEQLDELPSVDEITRSIFGEDFEEKGFNLEEATP